MLVLLGALALQAGAAAAPAEPPRAAEPPGLVIVAPAAWSDALPEYVAARTAEGFAVEVLTLEDAATRFGADAPERIKLALYQAWKERGARYVVLAGDADTVPVRFMTLDRKTAAAHDVAFYASDLYYADVAGADGAFEDWNARVDGEHAGYFGEVYGEAHKDVAINQDRVDYVPELAVGRWPVQSEDELRAVIAKTLRYRPASPAGPAPSDGGTDGTGGGGAGRPHALVVHADGWVDARDRVAHLADGLAIAGFDVERQIFGGDDPPTTASVRAALLAHPGLALHVGHGSDETWHACLGPADRDALAAASPSVFLSVGCSTAHLVNEPPYQPYRDTSGVDHAGTSAGEVFAEPPPPPAPLQPAKFDSTGLGERLVRMPTGGAVAYVGCVTGAQPCALTLLDGFADALAAEPSLRVGDAWRAAVAHYHAAERLDELVPTDSWYPPSVFFQGMKFALLGDPTVRVAAPR